MRNLLIGLVALGLLTALSTSFADTLLIERVEKSRTSTLPLKGSTMSAVEGSYGAPTTKHAAVGAPPITRWSYPAFTVYFEYDHVINAVVNKANPQEIGPRPVAARSPAQ